MYEYVVRGRRFANDVACEEGEERGVYGVGFFVSREAAYRAAKAEGQALQEAFSEMGATIIRPHRDGKFRDLIWTAFFGDADWEDATWVVDIRVVSSPLPRVPALAAHHQNNEPDGSHHPDRCRFCSPLWGEGDFAYASLMTTDLGEVAWEMVFENDAEDFFGSIGAAREAAARIKEENGD